MQVFYINLERRKDRNEQFLGRNAAFADFTRSDAVEGKSLRREDLVRDGLIQDSLRAYTIGALGSALSHKRLWERAVAEAAPVTVAEDDAIFNKHFSEKATKVLAGLPPDWDVILWGWNFDSVLHVETIEGLTQAVMTFSPRSLGARVSEFRDMDYDVLALRLMGAFGIVCYSVSPKGARLLSGSCFPLRNEKIFVPALRRALSNFSLDVMMNKYYGALKSYVSFPPLVWTENDKSTSDNAARGPGAR